MQKLGLITLAWLILVTFQAQAQSTEAIRTEKRADKPFKSAHGYLGLGLNWHSGYTLTATFFLRSGWGLAASTEYAAPKAIMWPKGYIKRFLSDYPRDRIQAYSLRLVREFPTPVKQFRLGLEAGLSLAKTEVLYFVRNASSTIVGERGYHRESIGLALKAKIEIPLTPMLGIEMAANTNLNPQRPYFALEFLGTLGSLRD